MKSGNVNFLEPSGPLQACNGTAFTNAWIPHERGARLPKIGPVGSASEEPATFFLGAEEEVQVPSNL